MAMFRRKPLEIEAIRVRDALRAARFQWGELPDWLVEAYNQGDVIFAASFVSILTLEGWYDYSLDYWLIRGVQGELYGCRDDVFQLTYEPIET